MRLRHFLIPLLGFFFCISCSSGIDSEFEPDKKFPAAQLRNDFTQLKDLLDHNHPVLKAFKKETLLDEYYDSVMDSLTDSLTIVDYYLLVRPLVSQINCGHTHLWLPEGYWSKMIHNFEHFPCKLYFDSNRAYVRYNYSADSMLTPGTEIMSINGTAMADIIGNFLLLIPSEGHNSTSKYYHMNQISFGLFPGYGQFPERYIVEFIPPGGNNPQVDTIEAAGYEQIKQHGYKPMIPDEINSYGLNIIDSLKTAIIDIDFFPYENKDQQRSFLQDAFERIKNLGLTSLIIDVRDNEGGDPFMASLLISYIIDRDYTYFADFVIGYPDLKRPMAPSTPNFRGDVYILMNGGSFSSTGHFLSLIRYYSLGKLVGEESGGTYHCNGCVKEFELDNTGLLLECPRCFFRTKVYGFNSDRGIFPDISIKPAIDDMINGSDAVMDSILTIIEAKL